MYRFRENSIAAVFQNQALRLPDRLYAVHRSGNSMVEITWEDMKERVRSLSYYLLSRGIRRSDRIAICSDNRIEWRIAALAIASVGAIDVPIATDARPEEISHMLGHSETRLCFVDSILRLDRLLPLKSILPRLEEIIVFDVLCAAKDNCTPLKRALFEGRKNPVRHHFEGRIQETGPDDISTIVYTRSAAGTADGVVLSHKSLLSAAKSFLMEMEDPYSHRDLVTEKDIFFSMPSPLNPLERAVGFYASVCRGATTVFSSGIGNLVQDLTDFRPTVAVLGNDAIEIIKKAVILNIELLPTVIRKQFLYAVRRRLKNMRRLSRPGLLNRLENRIFQRAFFANVKKLAGLDRLNYIIACVSLPPGRSPEIFEAIGLQILNCYGATSTHILTHFNRPWNIKPGTAGQPLFNTRTLLAGNGEVLIKSPHILSGYYLDEKRTKDVFTPEGFYKTEDLGFIDNEEFLNLHRFSSYNSEG